MSTFGLKENRISVPPDDLTRVLMVFSLWPGLSYPRAHGAEPAAVRIRWVEGKRGPLREECSTSIRLPPLNSLQFPTYGKGGFVHFS